MLWVINRDISSTFVTYSNNYVKLNWKYGAVNHTKSDYLIYENEFFEVQRFLNSALT